MGRETFALLTGLFVLALGAALVAIAIFLGDYGAERDVYVVTTLGSVSGLNPESTVIYRGVPAGKVTTIRFDPKDVRNILVRIEVGRGLPITKGTYATLRVQGLTGLAQVELNDAWDMPEPLVTSADQPAEIPLRPSLVDKLTESGQDLLPQLTQLAASLNTLVDDENRARVDRILSTAATAADHLVRLEDRLDDVLSGLPDLGGQVQQVLGEIAVASRNLREISQEMKGLAATSGELLASGKGAGQSLVATTLPQINTLVENLRVTSANLSDLSRMLRDDPQALLLGPQVPPPGPGEPGFREPE
jgi:phospholipid/cholesterol/gamma-HCH transport system substrate-binding protein